MRPEIALVPYAPGMLNASPLLVLAPHPDDEVFGCGGLLALAAGAGATVRVVVVTDGAAQGDPGVRRAECRSAALALGTPEPEHWGFADRGVDPGDAALRERIAATLEEVRPRAVLVPSPAEVHPDHRALAFATYQVLREAPPELAAVTATTRLATYEVSAVLHPNLLVDVTPVWERVMAAARTFASQVEALPYLEVLEGIATARRLTLPPEVRRAEAYYVVDTAWVREHTAASWAARQGPVDGLDAELLGPPAEVAELRAEVARLEDILSRIYASRTWRLHNLLERLRGRQ